MHQQPCKYWFQSASPISGSGHRSIPDTAGDRRHVLCNGAVLPLPTVQTAVGGNPVVIVKNLDSFVCYPHINFAFDDIHKERSIAFRQQICDN